MLLYLHHKFFKNGTLAKQLAPQGDEQEEAKLHATLVGRLGCGLGKGVGEQAAPHVFAALQQLPDYQLLALSNGHTDMTPAMLLQNIDFVGAIKDDVIDEEQWFRQACEVLDVPTLLSFITELVTLQSDGTLPPGADSTSPKRIQVSFGTTNKNFPYVQVCVYLLQLPHYPSCEVLIEQLRRFYVLRGFNAH